MIADTPDTHEVDEDGRVSVDGIAHVVQDMLYMSRTLIAREISDTLNALWDEYKDEDPEWAFGDMARIAADNLARVWLSSGRDEDTEIAYRVAVAVRDDVIRWVWTGAYMCGRLSRDKPFAEHGSTALAASPYETEEGPW